MNWFSRTNTIQFQHSCRRKFPIKSTVSRSMSEKIRRFFCSKRHKSLNCSSEHVKCNKYAFAETYREKNWNVIALNPQIKKIIKLWNLHTLCKIIIWKCRVQFYLPSRRFSRKGRLFSVQIPRKIWRKLF